MKRWIFTFRVAPPIDCVFSARNGSNVFFAAHSKWLGWELVYPGGSEKIDEPQMIFVSQEYADANKRESFGAERRFPKKLRGKEKSIQMALAL